VADTKISALTALTGANLATGDLVPVVDVSDTGGTGGGAGGTPKKITATEFATGLMTIGGLYVPQFAVKTADETVSASTTLQNDDHLFWSIGNSSTEIWFFELIASVSAANTTMDIKTLFTAPAGATIKWGTNATTGGPSSFATLAVSATPPGLNTNIATAAAYGTFAGTSGVYLMGMLYGGGTAGTVNFQWAQNTSDAGNLTVQKGSFIRYTKIAA